MFATFCSTNRHSMRTYFLPCVHSQLFESQPHVPIRSKTAQRNDVFAIQFGLKKVQLLVLMSVRFIISEISLRVEVLLENGLIRRVFDSCIVREDRSVARRGSWVREILQQPLEPWQDNKGPLAFFILGRWRTHYYLPTLNLRRSLPQNSKSGPKFAYKIS